MTRTRPLSSALALATAATALLPLVGAAAAAEGPRAHRHESAGHCEGGPTSRLAVWPDPRRAGIVGRIRIDGAEPDEEWTVEYTIVRRLGNGESVAKSVLALATADDHGTAVVRLTDPSDRRHEITVNAGDADGTSGCWAWASVRFAR